VSSGWRRATAFIWAAALGPDRERSTGLTNRAGHAESSRESQPERFTYRRNDPTSGAAPAILDTPVTPL